MLPRKKTQAEEREWNDGYEFGRRVAIRELKGEIALAEAVLKVVEDK